MDLIERWHVFSESQLVVASRPNSMVGRTLLALGHGIDANWIQTSNRCSFQCHSKLEVPDPFVFLFL